MKIKFQELEPTTRGKNDTNGMLLKGTKTFDDSPYEKFYFDSTQNGDETDIHKVAKTLKPGDIVELTYDKTKFKNLVGIEKLDESAGQTSPGSGRGSSSGGTRKSGGNFRNPDNTDRSSAMYLAWEIIIETEKLKGGKMSATRADSMQAQFEDLAKRLTAFVQTGSFPNGTTSQDKSKAEPREPGSDDGDDDIPF